MADWRWKLAFALVWLGLVGYAALLAPPPDPALERTLWHGAWSGRFAGVDPAIVAVFSLLGVIPALSLVLLLRDGLRQRLPGWPFAVAMFALGAFALLPYLVLRSPAPAPARPPGRLTRLLSSRPVGWILLATALALTVYGCVAGHAEAYRRAFGHSALVNVMTFDFAICSALLVVLVSEARRLDPPWREPPLAAALWRLPLLGPALWNALVVRQPPLVTPRG